MQKLKTDKMLSQLGRLSDEQFKVLFFIEQVYIAYEEAVF